MKQLLKKAGAKMRTSAQSRKRHICNSRFFNAISSEKQAYWLGFLAADGNVASKRSMLTVTLAAKDAHHISAFARDCDSTYTIRYYPKDSPRYATTVIEDRQLIADLALYGIVPAKTFTLCLPDLPSNLMRHYLRGYTDGDGGFYFSLSRPYNCNYKLTGRISFLQSVQQVLINACGLPETALQPYKGRHPDIAYLQYAGRLNLARLATYFYADATVYLLRKKERIDFIVNTSRRRM